MGLQDWSGKVKGQSREFIPKTPIAVDQLCFFVKKALTGFGDWFQVFPVKKHEFRQRTSLGRADS